MKDNITEKQIETVVSILKEWMPQSADVIMQSVPYIKRRLSDEEEETRIDFINKCAGKFIAYNDESNCTVCCYIKEITYIGDCGRTLKFNGIKSCIWKQPDGSGNACGIYVCECNNTCMEYDELSRAVEIRPVDFWKMFDESVNSVFEKYQEILK